MGRRILYVIDGAEFGGGERVFLQLIRALKDRYEISLAASPRGRLCLEAKSLGVLSHPLKMTSRLSFAPWFRLAALIRRNDVELIHSQGARADFYSRWASVLSGQGALVSTVAMPVEGFDVGPGRKAVYKYLDQMFATRVKRFIVVSETLRRLLIERRGIAPERVVCIYNGIELDRYVPSRSIMPRKCVKSLGLPPNATVLGAVGRMVWQKGFEYLIDAMPAVLRAAPKTHLLMIGDGPLRAELEALASRKGVRNHVLFLGFRPDLDELLPDLDILVVPSIQEGFPMIVLEGMACALPIVATRIEGIEEQLIQPSEGLLVAPRDPGAIARAVISVINEPNKSRIMGINARRKAEQSFSVREMVQKTEQVYRNLIS